MGGEHGESGGGGAEGDAGVPDQIYGKMDDGEVVVPATRSVEFFWGAAGA